jgi:twitching motility protein PilT
MDILSLVSDAKEKKASDLHISEDSLPMLRINGEIEWSDGNTILTSSDIKEFLEKVTIPEERERFYREKELDFGYTVDGVTRLRGNAAFHRGTISIALRLIPTAIPTIEELHLPEVCKELILKPRGLFIVSGPTGSGKSTTLAAMIDYLNHLENRRIVTIEDPLEYIFTNDKSSVLQRELGNDTNSFSQALKHVLRQDPDVIMVGEMRDAETAESVLILAETGHLVITTGHAPSSSQAVDRVIDLFPVHERDFAQTRMANLLVGIMCQTLVPTKDGEGRLPAIELMLANTAVSSLIRDGKIHQLPNVIRTHSQEGMVMLDQSLSDLYTAGMITGKSLLAFCNNRAEIEKTVGEINLNRDKNRKEDPYYKFFQKKENNDSEPNDVEKARRASLFSDKR